MLKAGSILGFDAIKGILPQRYPLLMLDRVEILSDKQAVAVKNMSINEHFFQGHFPGHPIVPGVLQVEAMKQLCELFIRQELDPQNTGDVYLRKLEKVKFRNPNMPADRMKIEITLDALENGEAAFTATTSNSSGLTCQALLRLARRPRPVPTAMPKLFNEFDRVANPVREAEAIKSIIPHRYPFLLVDSLVSIDGDTAIATKNVTGNEEFFAHADFAVLPESLMCEIVAQAGCIHVLAKEENRGKLGYFAAIMSAESLAPVIPGDQLVLELVLPPSKKTFGKGNGIIRVDGKDVFKIELMFAIVDK